MSRQNAFLLLNLPRRSTWKILFAATMPYRPAIPDSAVNKASSSAHATVDSLAGAADQAVRKAKPAIEQAAAMAHQAVDKAANVAAPAADWLTEQGESPHGRAEAAGCRYDPLHRG
jgi:hypothetical protein